MVLKTNACLSRSTQLYVNKIETSYLKFTYNVTYIGLGSELNSLVNFTAIRWSVFMNTSSLPFTIVSSIVSPFHNQKSFSYVMRAQFVPWFICIRKQNVGKQFIVAARMKMKKNNNTEIECQSASMATFRSQWKLVKLECKTHKMDFHLHLTHHNFAHQPTFSLSHWWCVRFPCHPYTISLN